DRDALHAGRLLELVEELPEVEEALARRRVERLRERELERARQVREVLRLLPARRLAGEEELQDGADAEEVGPDVRAVRLLHALGRDVGVRRRALARLHRGRLPEAGEAEARDPRLHVAVLGDDPGLGAALSDEDA